jgi:methyltransferase (TIGR00027 family)
MVNTRMPQKRIEHTTSRTASWICLCRALSSLERDPCYRSDDWVAPSLLPNILRLLIHIPFAGRLFINALATKGTYEYVIARTKYIDAAFSRIPYDRFTQILLFGAGFDTRALRFHCEAGQARIYELDAPATQQAKIDQYQKRHLSIPPNLVFVPIDFDKESLTAKLDQAGFKRDARSLFILEGVLMYLQPESVDQTFRTIRELAGAGSEVVFDYIYASVLRREDKYYGERGFADAVAKAGEEWRFGIEHGEIKQFLSKYGLELRDHRDAREMEEMYFKDLAGRIVGRVNGTHCLARAGWIKGAA